MPLCLSVQSSFTLPHLPWRFSYQRNGRAPADTVLSCTPRMRRRGSVSGATPGARQASGDPEEAPLPQPAVASSRGQSLPEAATASNAAAAAPAPRARAALGAAASDNWLNYDDRPAQAKGVYNFEAEGEAGVSPPARRASLPSRGRASGGGDGGPAPPGFSAGALP